MSAADRMAVRTPDGKIRSVARRVGLGMIARNQAKAAPHQNVPPAGVKGRRPASAVTIVTADAPELAPPVHVLSQTPGQIAETMRTGELPGGPAHSPVVDLADPAHGPVIDPTEFFEEDDPTALPVDAPAIETPKGNASRDVWAKYAGGRGVTVTEEMGRNEIRAAVAELALDRMSRPAFPDHSVDGGRPATPEDEPVTEDMVTSADPGERTA
jgi:hypothetical protein